MSGHREGVGGEQKSPSWQREAVWGTCRPNLGGWKFWETPRGPSCIRWKVWDRRRDQVRGTDGVGGPQEAWLLETDSVGVYEDSRTEETKGLGG